MQRQRLSLDIPNSYGIKMLYPNGQTNITGFNKVNQFTYLPYRESKPRGLAYFGNDSISSTSSIPEGTFQSVANILPPIVSGGMSSADNQTSISLTTTLNLLRAKLLSGGSNATITVNAGSLSIIVALNGSGDITLTAASASLSFLITMSGSGDFTLTASGAALSSIVGMSADTTITLTGTADLKSLVSLSGESTPFTELSPESLAASLWNSLAASYNLAGTMGEKLNDAGSASNPWTEVIESGYTAAEIMSILVAAAAGKTSIVDLGMGDATVTFRNLADTKDRIIGDMEGSERIDVTFDVS